MITRAPPPRAGYPHEDERVDYWQTCLVVHVVSSLGKAFVHHGRSIMERKKVIVLHSGGLNSTVCLYEAATLGHDVTSLGIDYGQRHVIELLFAQRQCEKKGIVREVAHVSWRKPQRELPLSRSVEEIRVTPSRAFLPGRNMLFLALGSAHAAGLGADEIWIGINSVDFSGYPDCTPEFFKAFAAAHDIGVAQGTIRAPLLTNSKPEIARKARDLGLQRTDTWSCYRPQLNSGNVTPCGSCDACTLHNYAWDNVGKAA